MGTYSIQDIDMVKNYVRPCFGGTALCRELSVSVINSEALQHDVDVYTVTFQINSNFEPRIETIERDESICGETTQYTPINDVVYDLLAERFDC